MSLRELLTEESLESDRLIGILQEGTAKQLGFGTAKELLSNFTYLDNEVVSKDKGQLLYRIRIKI